MYRTFENNLIEQKSLNGKKFSIKTKKFTFNIEQAKMDEIELKGAEVSAICDTSFLWKIQLKVY